jgi:hypothetical protein
MAGGAAALGSERVERRRRQQVNPDHERRAAMQRPTVFAPPNRNADCRRGVSGRQARGTSMNFRQFASIVSVSRRCFVVAGLFRCVGRRRSVGEHQPVPRLERTQPFRAACGNAPPKRARLGPVPLGNDAHHTAGRNRLVRQQVGEHRPAGVVHGLRHVSSPASSGSHLRGRPPRNAHETARHHVGGNADACWRFSPHAPLREPSAGAVQ